jgi:hypothetical protein
MKGDSFMRYSSFLSLCAVCLTLSACNLVRDTPAHHAVHKGEIATLSPKHAGPVWVGVDRTASEDVNEALESGDRAALAGLETKSLAFQVERGTQVEVIGERYNDRQIKIISAAQAGKTGWVPFEWLQPVTKAQQ